MTLEFYFSIYCGVFVGIPFLIVMLIYFLKPAPIYIVTNKRIVKIYNVRLTCWLFYDEIKKIRLIGAGKNFGGIKIKPKKIDGIDYTFEMLENPDEIYRILQAASGGEL